MRNTIGDDGTEQFTVTTRVNGQNIGEQRIHDPFIRTQVRLRGFRHAWNALTKGIVIQVAVDGSEGASRAIMTLDPDQLKADTDLILSERAKSRAENGIVGLYAMEARRA